MTDSSQFLYVPVEGECVIGTDEDGLTYILNPDSLVLRSGNATISIEFPPEFILCQRINAIQSQGATSDGQ